MELFNPPKHLKKPQLEVIGKNYNAAFDKLSEDEDKYLVELTDFVKKRKSGKYIGKVIKFPVADGYAKYMVASVRPLELVNIPFDDEYEFQYIYNLKWKDIRLKIEQEELLNKLFSPKN